jgi:hypothetical protein
MPAGFGIDSFGDVDFGVADVGREILYDKLPAIYKELDKDQNFLLKRFLRAFGEYINEKIVPLIRDFPLLRDARFIRLDLLDLLAHDFGIDTDDQEKEQYRRSELLHLYQWLIRKGEDKGYKIKGGVRSLIIDIQRLDRKKCGLDPALIPADRERFVRMFDDTPGDVVILDDILLDDVDAWPYLTKMVLVDNGYFDLCRTNYLKLLIDISIVGSAGATNLVKFARSVVVDVKPIHVRLIIEVLADFVINWGIIANLDVDVGLGAFVVWSYYYEMPSPLLGYYERVDFAIRPSLEVIIT